MTSYHHTQIGWQVYAVFAPVVLLGIYVFFIQDPGVLALLLAIFVLVFVIFGWLTVDIDTRRLRIAFGLGLVRRTISLDTIRGFAAVKNPWYYGWGIRLTPHGILYNVSGLSAVELLLDNGRRVRVGTDEPEALVRALAAATRIEHSRSVDQFPKDAAWRRKVRLFSIASVALVGVLILGQMYLYSREPSVDLSNGTVSVGVGAYEASIPVSSIASVSLAETLPRILRRTNGFAARGLLRGNFILEEWGRGVLLVNRGTPPYVVIHTGQTFVVVNFEDAARTRAFYEQLQSLAGRP